MLSRLNVPNFLTLTRIAAIPLLAAVFYMPFEGNRIVATCLFFLIGITDWFDGWYARKFNKSSKFGAFLDPVADKICVSVVLVLVVAQDARPLLAIPVSMIIARELIVSGLREWMSELGQRAAVAVGWVGKWKTTAQFFALGFLIWRDPAGWFPTYTVGTTLLVIAAILAVWSMCRYLWAAWPVLRDNM